MYSYICMYVLMRHMHIAQSQAVTQTHTHTHTQSEAVELQLERIQSKTAEVLGNKVVVSALSLAK